MKVIQSLLGHLDINTTQKTYVHVTDKKKKEAVDLINNSLSLKSTTISEEKSS
jgi:site-specific recombinase XerD